MGQTYLNLALDWELVAVERSQLLAGEKLMLE